MDLYLEAAERHDIPQHVLRILVTSGTSSQQSLAHNPSHFAFTNRPTPSTRYLIPSPSIPSSETKPPLPLSPAHTFKKG
ncbi:hypothetical protein AUEXF2481DRAFT_45318 [Aureobasidium subglaciale EXF-2481]|uniref:Uncharacterized protein n=1 Tax=Aureobasidium subglaciale (strain EXF-2481) TaxID=1043005 RepID=A0A074XXL5_AURSE|nr:uncharacterized protein AUEXF2481DRAFT_45318 [Aureobasidium subglaciale EXF-2481]KEQ90210.1 hypothetical protein AUEXF2481DRAFT_45318 [Aureobasidium subglaciale EXF-2481]